MRRHRGLLYGLALMALSGFMANRAEAGSITLSIDFDGTVLASATSTGTNQTVDFSSADVNNANITLAGLGSAYRLSGLSADSNFSGGATGFLQITGQLSVAAVGNTSGTISFDATQSGFLLPMGPGGTATTSSVANLGGGAVTLTSYTGDFQGTPLPSPIVFTGAGPSFSGSTSPTPIGSVPTGYSLSSHYVISLANIANSSEGVTGTTTVTAQSVPEPASLVMLLTGLPVPLVFMGLLRRRKAKA